jgi:sorbose reductase
VNVKSQEQVETAVDQVVKDFNNRLDVFVANAGIPWIKGPILDAKDVRFRSSPLWALLR